jgi:hypothetical protein
LRAGRQPCESSACSGSACRQLVPQYPPVLPHGTLWLWGERQRDSAHGVMQHRLNDPCKDERGDD